MKKRKFNRSFAAEYLAGLCEPYRRQGDAICEGVPVGTEFTPLLLGILITSDIGIAIENFVRKNYWGFRGMISEGCFDISE